MPDPLVQAPIAHFDSVFEGPNGDYPAVLEAFAGLMVVQAAWKPAPDHNSLWQLVDHLAASKVWQIDMLEKGQAASPLWTHPAGEIFSTVARNRKSVLAACWGWRYDDPVAAELAAFLKSRHDEILDLVERAERLALAL